LTIANHFKHLKTRMLICQDFQWFHNKSIILQGYRIVKVTMDIHLLHQDYPGNHKGLILVLRIISI